MSLVLGVGACGQPTSSGPHDRLSDYGYFEGALADQQPVPGVLPFTVAARLWADNAAKGRFLVLPEGGRVESSATEDWVWPQGSVLIKNFFFDVDGQGPGDATRIVETRLLTLEEGLWRPSTYVWDEQQTDAWYQRAGERVDVQLQNADGTAFTQEYLVPNTDECNSCHEQDAATRLLGLTTRQLNFTGTLGDDSWGNQLHWLAEEGVFSEALPDVSAVPALVDPFGDGELEVRARSYLHANCGHCHRPGGGAEQSGLYLQFDNTDPFALGVCKEPAAAGPGTGGREWDIVPGAPDESILVFRMAATDPEIKMPEIPNRLPDIEGVELVRAWIAAMPPDTCGAA